MIQKYLYILFILFSFQQTSFAQEKKNNVEFAEQISIYPNPTTINKITIQTESNLNKEVEIFDMLGKKVLSLTFSSKEREIVLQNLKAGVYIIKIKEENNSTSRKLVIK